MSYKYIVEENLTLCLCGDGRGERSTADADRKELIAYEVIKISVEDSWLEDSVRLGVVPDWHNRRVKERNCHEQKPRPNSEPRVAVDTLKIGTSQRGRYTSNSNDKRNNNDININNSKKGRANIQKKDIENLLTVAYCVVRSWHSTPWLFSSPIFFLFLFLLPFLYVSSGA